MAHCVRPAAPPSPPRRSISNEAPWRMPVSGNIAGAILLAAGGRHSMVSHNGTAGHAAGRIQEFNYPMPSGAILVMCSDGLLSQWDLTAYPGIRTRSATIIAAALYRDFSRRRDDATVVVVKERPAFTEKL